MQAPLQRLYSLRPLIRFRIPERSRQTNRREDRHHLVGRRPARFDREPIPIPRNGEMPELFKINQRPLRNSVRFTPKIDSFFRPEEKHGRSRKNDVVSPMRCGHSKVREERF